VTFKQKEEALSKRAENVMQARLRMATAAYSGDISADEVLRLTLDELEALTGSVIGFYHFLEADQETLSLQGWSTNTIKTMCNAEGKGSHYNISQAGVWVDCVRERRPVIHNEYVSLPHRKGMPEGHAQVIREMVVPIMRGERIVAIIGLGNKPTDYNETDIEIASLLGDFSWEIVERKRTEEALQKSNAFNQSIIDSSSDCIKILDLEGRLQFMSPGGQHKLGIRDLGIYLNIPYQEFWKGSDHEAALEAIRKAQQGQSGSFEGYCPTVDGTPKWWDVAISPIFGADGKPERLLAVSRDITERKKAEEHIITLNEKLERKVDELSSANMELEAFSYSVSHDLRSPLRSIDGFSQAILEDYGDKLDENGKDFLLRIRAASQRMGLLIDGLLNLSRMLRSKVVRKRVDLSALAHDIAVNLSTTQPERKVEIVIAEGLIDEGDERLLYVLLQNLLGNAWKYTEKCAKARIEFGVSQVDGKPAYFVRDNGIGFDMAYAHKLFRPFQRLHDAADFSGTGVGLATVKRIIRRHNGQVWAEGKAEKGATFYFTLK